MNKKQKWDLRIGTFLVLIAVMILCALAINNPIVGYFFRTTLAPVATVVIGFCVAIITFYNYQQKTKSEFVVNYAVSVDGDSPNWLHFGTSTSGRGAFSYSDIAEAHMPYIAKIYIRNEKDKTEVIRKIFLQFNNKIILPIAIYDNKPLLLKPFSHTTETLDPATYYSIEGGADTNHYVTGRETGQVILHGLENKIIIQTEERLHYVKPNIIPKGIEVKKLIILIPTFQRYMRKKILPYKVEFIYSAEIVDKPSDEELGIVSESKDWERILKSAEIWNIRIAAIKNSEKYLVNYYFLSKNNEQYFFHHESTGWKNFCEKHKNSLKIKDENDLAKLKFFFDSYIREKHIQIMASDLSCFSGKSEPPKTIQELLAKKKPTVTQRLRNIFFHKKEEDEKKAGTSISVLSRSTTTTNRKTRSYY